MLKLYSYFRSSASYRVRIALHWKGLEFEYIPVHLTKDGGEQHQKAYREINPMGHVPALDHDGFVIAESMAIMDYLDQVFPEKPLFPRTPKERAKVIQTCEIINSGIQPLQNLKVTNYVAKELGLPDKSTPWAQHWIRSGLANLEAILKDTAGTYCFGGEFTAADAFLVPQCHSARRFGLTLDEFPLIARLEAQALELEAVKRARPGAQPDAPAV